MTFENRNYLLDNTKISLIFLMIYGHMIQSFIPVSTAYKSVFLFIYSFHMPLLAFISGIVSKSTLSNSDVGKLISKLGVPLVAFQIVYEIPLILFSGVITACTFNLQPNALQWYLLSLLSWRLMLPLFNHLRYPILFSFLIALFSGVSSNTGEYLGISRTLHFFPIFLLGHYIGIEHLSRLTFKGSKLAYASVLIIAAGIFYFYPQIDQRWMFGSFAYVNLGHHEWYAFVNRIYVYCSAIIIGGAFLGLIPSAKNRISYLGAHVLYVYLWSGLYVVALGALNVQKFVFTKLSTSLSLAVFFCISLVVFYLLSAKEVITFTDKWVFRPFEYLLIPKKSRIYTVRPQQSVEILEQPGILAINDHPRV